LLSSATTGPQLQLLRARAEAPSDVEDLRRLDASLVVESHLDLVGRVGWIEKDWSEQR
jgi:hypothetical protein